MAKKLYLNISLDADAQKPVIIYSKHGGQPLSRIMANHPRDVHKIHIEYAEGLDLKDLLHIGEDVGIERRCSTLAFLTKNLYECFL